MANNRIYTLLKRIIGLAAPGNGGGHGNAITTVDINNITTPGVYWINALDSKTNLPDGASYGLLCVIKSSITSGVTFWIYLDYASGRTWKKTKIVQSSGTTWHPSSTSWYQLTSNHNYANPSGTTQIATTSGSWKYGGSSIKIPAGNSVVFCTASFPSNATGRRILAVNSTASGTSSGWTGSFYGTAAAVNGANTTVKVQGVIHFDSETTIYAHLYQNSGSALNATVYWSYIKIDG